MMLWSLLKIIAFVAVVMALTYGGTYLMELSGGAILSVAGYEVSLSLLHLVALSLLFIVLVWLGLRVLSFLSAVVHFLIGDETAISRYFDRNRESKGYEALNDGFIALASGDARLAQVKAARAQKYLDAPQLSTLLSAQAASRLGHTEKAELFYKQLLDDNKTRFVGVKGLLEQKLAAGDHDTALALAQKAFALNPKHEKTQDTLLTLQTQSEDWVGARQTLNAKLKSGALPRDVHKRRDAVLAYALAQDLLLEGDELNGNAQALEAHRLSPSFIPAAVLAAQVHMSAGRMRKAAGELVKTWGAAPHPELARAFANLVPDETPEQRLKRFKALIKKAPDHPESKMLMAELLISAEDFPGARRLISQLVETQPSARNLTLMAAVERGEGADESIVRAWLAKALGASSGPQWVCASCQSVHEQWLPVCGHCQAFDGLDWTETQEEFNASGILSQTQMLPLIIGEPEKERSLEHDEIHGDSEK